MILSYHSLPLVNVSLSCSLFSELSERFLSPTFPFSSSFFLSYVAPFPSVYLSCFWLSVPLSWLWNFAFFFVLSPSFWKLPHLYSSIPPNAFYLLFRTFAFLFEPTLPSFVYCTRFFRINCCLLNVMTTLYPSWDDNAVPNRLSLWIIHEYTPSVVITNT